MKPSPERVEDQVHEVCDVAGCRVVAAIPGHTWRVTRIIDREPRSDVLVCWNVWACGDATPMESDADGLVSEVTIGEHGVVGVWHPIDGAMPSWMQNRIAHELEHENRPGT